MWLLKAGDPLIEVTTLAGLTVCLSFSVEVVSLLTEKYFSDCGRGFKLDGGQVDFTGHPTTYNSNVSVSCLDGYDLNGDNYIICLASGQWSKTATCVAKGIFCLA